MDQSMSKWEQFWTSEGGLVLAMILALALIWFGWGD
jgi:hypothetical protein